jgi:hypothetical protein
MFDSDTPGGKKESINNYHSFITENVFDRKKLDWGSFDRKIIWPKAFWSKAFGQIMFRSKSVRSIFSVKWFFSKITQNQFLRDYQGIVFPYFSFFAYIQTKKSQFPKKNWNRSFFSNLLRKKTVKMFFFLKLAFYRLDKCKKAKIRKNNALIVILRTIFNWKLTFLCKCFAHFLKIYILNQIIKHITVVSTRNATS